VLKGENLISEKIGKLRRFNIIMGFMHLIQGSALFWLGTVVNSDFVVPITLTQLVGEGSPNDPSSFALVPKLEIWREVTNFGPAVATFLLASAVAHFLISGPFYDKYKEDLGKGINKVRWIEYSISASVMIVLIALLVGIYDIWALLGIFFMNAAMCWFGWMMEVNNQYTDRVDWTSYIMGCLVGVAPWIFIFINLIGDGVATDSNPQGVPQFVVWIFVSIFLFFNTFSINMVLQYKGVGKWKDYLYGERAYIWLSLLAKTALAWQVFFGTYQPN
tara:strand:+ start:69 stop:893 length:825 start_codon:yes stop_codon:yes gene_type:complete